MNKYDLGWPSDWQHLLQKHAPDKVARIIQKHKINFRVKTLAGEDLNCYLPGKLLQFENPTDEFAVGDWCILGSTFIDESNTDSAFIEEIIPRKSKISRAAAGPETAEQILAANVDFAFIVTSVNGEFNVSRLRRYLLLAANGGVEPKIVLSKIDLIEDATTSVIAEMNAVFPEVECIVTSALQSKGVDSIAEQLGTGKTAVFIGTSGVGKSSLVNSLLGTILQKTNAIKNDDRRGRHTTTASRLIFVPTGGIIIDTPGLREVGLVGEESNLQRMMPSVAVFAAQCKFTNCSHTTEPQCAVNKALESGNLEESDFAAYEKLERELAYNRRKTDQRAAIDERTKWKKIAIKNRQRNASR